MDTFQKVDSQIRDVKKGTRRPLEAVAEDDAVDD